MKENGSFWQQRVRAPLLALFAQGVSSHRMALAFAVGSACSLFPFLGFTSLLNLGMGWWLRLNHPLLQALNQVLGPVQLVMIVPYVRLGERVWGAPDGGFTVGEMLRVFREADWRGFLHDFGWAGVHAFTAWLLTSPLVVGAVYFAVRPVLRRLASKSPSGA